MEEELNNLKCPICGSSKVKLEPRDHPWESCYICDVCGNFILDRKMLLTGELQRRIDLYILSGVIKQVTENNKLLNISSQNIDSFINSANVPKNIFEFIDRAMLLIFKRISSISIPIKISIDTDFPFIFSKNSLEFLEILNKCKELGYFDNLSSGYGSLKLSLQGWKHIEELKKRNISNPKLVFMAMQYNDVRHDKIYTEHFVHAVDKTGFELKRLNEMAQAGIIDNLLRTQIHQCRFLLADLTNENRGAYWEAGFAEGLGKPVIYLCRKNDEGTLKTHFDTNHHTTIIWDETNIQKAVEELKATIRATFPNEALMAD